jgi:threonine aldolase
MSHWQRGDEVIVADSYHTHSHEAGGASVLGSLVMQSISATDRGYISADQVAAAIRPNDSHFAQSKLVSIENTVSGFIQPQAELEAIAALAKENNLNTHLDGARLMHAVVATGHSAAKLCQAFDSVSLCLSKGLGAPAGSVLSGSSNFIQRAKRLRKMLGGGMRQAGIIAAAGIYALDNNVERLLKDHQLALYFAQQLNQIEPLSVDISQIETNMLFVNFPLAAGKAVTETLAKHLIKSSICISDATNCRIVLHLDIAKPDVDQTIQQIKQYYAA